MSYKTNDREPLCENRIWKCKHLRWSVDEKCVSHAFAVILTLKFLASFRTFFLWRTEPDASRTTTVLLLTPHTRKSEWICCAKSVHKMTHFCLPKMIHIKFVFFQPAQHSWANDIPYRAKALCRRLRSVLELHLEGPHLEPGWPWDEPFSLGKPPEI